MVFWGWLPHIYPGLKVRYPEQYMGMYLSRWKDIQVYSTDHSVVNEKDYNPELRINLKEDFSYSKSFEVSVKYSEEDQIFDTVEIILHEDGFISIKPVLKKGSEELSNDRLRSMVRPIYYFFRHILDCALITKYDSPFNPVSSSSNNRDHIDDVFTITENESDSKEEALEDTVRLLIDACEDALHNIRDQSNVTDLSKFTDLSQNQDIYESIDILNECAYWGKNLMELEKRWYNRYDEFSFSFDMYKDLASEIVSSLNLRINVGQNSRSIDIGRTSIGIGKKSIVIALMAALVSFLAGSLFCEFTKDNESAVYFTVFVTIVLFALLVVGFLWNTGHDSRKL